MMEGEDPSHKALMYFLEILMNSENALTISQLAGRFGSRDFTSQMRQAAGGNEAGLKRFLMKYPSLFSIKGNMVSADLSMGLLNSEMSSASGAGDQTDVVKEAVQYFQQKMMRKEDTWIPIKSLAGHLSQASANVREYVGPQADFKNFLLLHPDVFDVHEEIVALKENTTPKYSRKTYKGSQSLENDSKSKTVPGRGRGRGSWVDKAQESGRPGSGGKKAPVTMTGNEYKALNYIKNIVEKKGNMKIHNITGHFSQAPESVRNTIGWTKYELEEFIKKYAVIFNLDEDGLVTVNKNARLNVVITGSKPQTHAVQSLNGRKGKIFHVAKLWGIIDLGKHEHVFFDRSIYHKDCDDLQKDFKVGEYLNFNAVLAAKSSRAKWRATQIWKDDENSDTNQSNYPQIQTIECGEVTSENLDDMQDDDFSKIFKHSDSIEEEINKLLPTADIDFGSSDEENEETSIPESTSIYNQKETYADAAPSGAGVIPVWDINTDGNDPEKTASPNGIDSSSELIPNHNLTMISESYLMRKSVAAESHSMSGYIPVPDPSNVASSQTEGKDKIQDRIEPKFKDACCQTISTGEILATQLYKPV